MSKTYMVAMVYSGDCCSSSHVRQKRIRADSKQTALGKLRAILVKEEMRPGECVATLLGAKLVERPVQCRDCKGEGEQGGERCGTCKGWGAVSKTRAKTLGWTVSAQDA